MAAAASAAPAILTDADRAERALRIPPSDRKPADILSILKWAKEFVKLPEEIPLERLCAVMELREYHAKQCCLFRQGDEGDSYYVVFSGEVGMYQEAEVQVGAAIFVQSALKGRLGRKRANQKKEKMAGVFASRGGTKKLSIADAAACAARLHAHSVQPALPPCLPRHPTSHSSLQLEEAARGARPRLASHRRPARVGLHPPTRPAPCVSAAGRAQAGRAHSRPRGAGRARRGARRWRRGCWARRRGRAARRSRRRRRWAPRSPSKRRRRAPQGGSSTTCSLGAQRLARRRRPSAAPGGRRGLVARAPGLLAVGAVALPSLLAPSRLTEASRSPPYRR